jgi:predicted ribosome quality control (RQC) complex YloA/Tae2 family protein
MKQRLKKIDRLIKVQQHLQKNAELQLANLQRREGELKAAQVELLETMGVSDALHGLFVNVIAKRLKALALEETLTQAAIIDQKAVAVERALQVKRTEKVSSRLKDEARRGQEKKDLISILETIAQKECTSLP